MSHDPQLLSRAFMVYVRPLLEYCTPVWCPYNKGDINTIERVQRAFTRKIGLFYLCHLPPVSYEDRLLHLGLQRLEIRRIHSDLIFLFEIIPGLVHLTLLFSNSVRVGANTRPRGHKYKLFRTRSHKLVLSNFLLIAFYLFGMTYHHYVLTLTGYLLLDAS